MCLYLQLAVGGLTMEPTVDRLVLGTSIRCSCTRSKKSLYLNLEPEVVVHFLRPEVSIFAPIVCLHLGQAIIMLPLCAGTHSV